MGKIKSKVIKKSAGILIEKELGFTEKFEDNKKILGNTMPSKKIRNKLAGYIARLQKRNNSKKD